MKSFLCFMILALTITISACSVTVPISRSTRELHHQGRVVQPGYETRTKSKKLPFTVGCSLVGAGLFYAYSGRNTSSKTAPLSASQMQENQLKAAGVGFGLTFLALGLGYVYNRNAASSTRWLSSKVTFESATTKNFNQWLGTYNKSHHSNYIPVAYTNNHSSVILVPPNNLEEFVLEQRKIDEKNVKNEEIRRQHNSETNALILGGLLYILLNSDGNTRSGTGTSQRQKVTCDQCGGTGGVWRFQRGDNLGSYRETCPKCNGSGKLVN